jgi:hypothetical protein
VLHTAFATYQPVDGRDNFIEDGVGREKIIEGGIIIQVREFLSEIFFGGTEAATLIIIVAALLGHAGLRAMKTTRLYLRLDARLPGTARTTSARGELRLTDDIAAPWRLARVSLGRTVRPQ